jgi:hypothetical protein
MNATLYHQGHLVVSAIRILEHQKKVPPSVEDVCRCLSYSVEQGNRICGRLHELGIIEVVRGAFGTKLFVRNHLQLEELPREEEEGALAKEVKKFQDSRKGLDERITAFKTRQDEKKRSLFADLEKKLRTDVDKKEDPSSDPE